jgi:hypothetical protein
MELKINPDRIFGLVNCLTDPYRIVPLMIRAAYDASCDLRRERIRMSGTFADHYLKLQDKISTV